MKNPSSKMTVLTVAVLSLALTQAPKAAADDAAQSPANYQQNSSEASQSTTGAPAQFNRASCIVGMEVRNQNNEKLGKIKDVVFDLNTEKVSYAVLAAKKGTFEEKYLAIPINALRPGDNTHYLILNADRSQVASAMGFDRNHWPAVANPSWGAEPFWQSDSNKSSYAPDKSANIPAVTPSDSLTPSQVPTPVPAGVPPRAGEPQLPLSRDEK